METNYKTKRNEQLEDQKLYAQLLQIRNGVDGWAREICENLLPNRPRFVLSANDKGRMNENIFDSTATLALRTAQAGLLAGVTSPASPWMVLGLDDEDLFEVQDVKYYVDAVNKKIMRTYDRSNFYREMSNHFLDTLTLPAATTLIEKDPIYKIRFNTLSWGSYVLGVDENGDVNTIGREEEFTVRQLVMKFGEKDSDGNYDMSNFSEQVKLDWESGTEDQLNRIVTVCHIIKPNENRDANKPQSKYKKYVSRYSEKSNAEYNGKYLRESGFDYFPAMVSRWSTRSQEVYSNDCPGLQVIGDIKQLYKNTEDLNHSIDLINDPPLVGPDAFNNEIIQKGPGGFTPDNSVNVTSGLRPLFEITHNNSWLKDKLSDIKSIINRGFFVDTILAATMLRQQVTGQVTATEIEALRDEKLIEFGPVTQSFFRTLRHCIDVTFFILNEAGEMPPPPEELIGRELPPEFISPFARAQKIALLGPIERMLGTIERIIGSGYTDIVDKIDLDQVVDEISRLLNLPPGIIRPDDVVAEMRRVRAEQAQAQQQTEQMNTMADTGKTLSQSPTDGDTLLNSLLGMANAGKTVG